MATVYVGSARIGENGLATGGKDGDQKQTTPASAMDLKGEVSEQIYYTHSKGWIVLVPTDPAKGSSLGDEMHAACSNVNIGYNQNERGDVVAAAKSYGSLSKITKKVNSDCSALVRACIIAALGFDPGNFTTYDEVNVLVKSGRFKILGKIVLESGETVKYGYSAATGKYTRVADDAFVLHKGDVLVTATKGHTVIVTQAPDNTTKATDKVPVTTYYPKCDKKYTSIVDALNSIKVDSSKENRKKIATLNGITNYNYSASQNTALLTLLKNGKLIKSKGWDLA